MTKSLSICSMRYLTTFFITFSIWCCSITCHKHSSKPLVFLVSLDGFRWDYLKKFNLTNFNQLKSVGSHADFIYNSFATVTFPNHWTIVTGMYEETHGIVNNEMFDPLLKDTFESGSKKSIDHKWYGQNKLVEPIWITNQKAGNGRKSAAAWVGAGVSFDKQSPIYIPYDGSKPYSKLIDEFIALFTREKEPINFGAMYIDEPDKTGHKYGPYSKEMENKLKDLDKTLGYLIQELKSHHLFDKINLIVTSDHGMEEVSEKTAIYLDSYVDTNLFDIYGRRATYNLFVKKKDDIKAIYNKLKVVKNLIVYKKEDIPEQLHYKKNIRIGDLLLIAKLGHGIYLNKNKSSNWNVFHGDHGYMNNQSAMYPIFIAHGPAIKKNFKIKSFNNVDIYPLMCLLLGVQPAINNGSIHKVFDMVVYKGYDIQFSYVYLLIFLIPLLLVLTTFSLFCFCNPNKKRYSAHYTSITQNELLIKEENGELSD